VAALSSESATRQRSRRGASDRFDGAGAAVGDVHAVPIGNVEAKVCAMALRVGRYAAASSAHSQCVFVHSQVGFAPNGASLKDSYVTVGVVPQDITTAAAQSGLRSAMLSRSKRGHNPLDKWLEFSGEGHADAASLKLQVYISFADTMKERFVPALACSYHLNAALGGHSLNALVATDYDLETWQVQHVEHIGAGTGDSAWNYWAHLGHICKRGPPAALESFGRGGCVR
jgi:hypothetical protein